MNIDPETPFGDPVLLSVVGLIAKHEYLTCSVAFTYQGIVIEGNIVNAKAFFASCFDEVRSMDAIGLSNSPSIPYPQRSQLETDLIAHRRESEQRFYDLKSNPPSLDFDGYIHLRDATVHTSSGGIKTPLWRGRIEKIDSIFNLGGITAITTE
jgi:hypothetical protein